MEGWGESGGGVRDGLIDGPYYQSTMLELLDYAVIFAVTVLSFSLTAYLSYRIVKPKAVRALNGYMVTAGNRIQKEMRKMGEEALEGIDLGAISGALGGGESGGAGLGQLAGMFGGGLEELAPLIQLLGGLGGKQTTKGKEKIGL